MKTPLPIIAGFLALALAGCDSILGENRTPDNIAFRLQGETGTPVRVILSRQFVVGVDELGVTQVGLAQADTLLTTIPMDTVLNISVERRFFAQVTPPEADSITGARITVVLDGRTIFDDQGSIFPDPPFRYVYAFNQPTTRLIEVF